jgi:CubicO group peptidase (beta-lactamase class C family)
VIVARAITRTSVLQDIDLARVLDQAAVGHLVAGAAVCLLEGDTSTTATTGVLDLRDNVPITDQTLFPLGSVTKTLTAVIVCQLVAEGRIGLDEPVVRHLPELAALGESSEAISARMLLSHTAGIADAWEWFPSFAALLDASRRAGPVGDPGELFSYSNTGYVVLGQLVERLTGTSWEAAVRSRVLTAVGTASATFTPPQPLPGTAATGHVSNGAGHLVAGDLWPPTGRLFGPAGATMYATAADTASLVLACATGRVRGGAELLPAELHQEMLTEQIALPGLPLHFRGWSLGWGVPAHGSPHAVQHIGGTSALVHADPDRGLVLAVLTNFPEGWAFGRDVVRAVLGLPEDPPPVSHADVDPTRYTGQYQSPAFGIDVHSVEGQLRVTNPLGGADVDLHHQRGDAFWADFGDLVTEVTFFDVNDGKAQRMHAALRMLQRADD